MEKEVIEEITRECKNWRERLLVKLFPNTYIKAYHIGRIKTVNILLNKNLC